MILFQNFSANVKAGLITLSKVNDAYALTKKQFNPDTGVEIEPETVSIDPNDLEVKRQELLSAIAQIDIVLDHLKKL